MVELLPRRALAPVVEAVQALRGISIPGAITLVAEIGSLSRFENPRQLIAYLGLVPSDHSSGSTMRRAPIPSPATNWHARVSSRQPGPAGVRHECPGVGVAQAGFCRRYRHLMAAGKAET